MLCLCRSEQIIQSHKADTRKPSRRKGTG